MRVAIYHNILWSKYKGAVFSHVHSAGRQRGIDPTFIQIAETEEMRIGLGSVDLSYHQYPFRLLFRGSYTKAPLVYRIATLARDLYKYPCDLVVMPGYDRAEYWGMLLVCIFLRRKRAVFCDSTVLDKPRGTWRDFAKRRFFALCDGFFCYGTRSKEYILSYGVSEDKIIYRVQAAALPLNYSAVEVLRHYEANWQPLGNAPRFVYVGRISPEKGLNDLFSAFSIVRRTFPEATLEVVGSGPLAENFKARARQDGLSGIAFLGTKGIEEIAQILQESTALVLPSHSEPWGLVVNESLSYGCPVVVSSVCGCAPDLVIDGETGYRFSSGDVDGLARSMLDVVRLSEDRVNVARRCLKLMENFTPERAAAQILDGCIKLLEKET